MGINRYDVIARCDVEADGANREVGLHSVLNVAAIMNDEKVQLRGDRGQHAGLKRAANDDVQW